MADGLACLDVSVGVPDAFRALFAAFGSAGRPPDVVVGGGVGVGAADGSADAVNAELTRAVVERTAYLSMHAAVVCGARGAIVAPADSGVGKSTLAAALARARYALMSDELAAFSPGGRTVLAFPRPLTLDARSARLVGLPPPPSTAKHCYPPTMLGPPGPASAPVAAVVLLTRGEQVTPGLAPLPASEAAGALLTQCFNHFRDPPAALRTIAALCGAAPAWRLTYRSATDAVATLRPLLGRAG